MHSPPEEEPQEIIIIQQWSTQKAQFLWFFDPTEFLILALLFVFLPFTGWQFGTNIYALLIPGTAYLTLLVSTKMGRRRGYLSHMIRYLLRSKIWYPGAYDDAAVHQEINPELDMRSIRHVFDPDFQMPARPDSLRRV